MGKTLFNRLKLGLAGLVFAGGLNGCDNSRETTKSYIPKNDAKENLVKKSKEIIINNTFNKYGEAIFSQRFSKKVYSENLCINLNDNIYYVTKKNEEKGIKDLIKISQDYEEGWLYLPEKQIWYEIGEESYIIPEKKHSQVSPIDKNIMRILEKNKGIKELIFYHNHPYTKSPSREDIIGMVNHTFSFQNYKVKEKICSREGISEYSLTEKAIKEFKLKETIKLEDYSSYMKDSSITLNPEYFTLTFKPFEKIKNEDIK